MVPPRALDKKRPHSSVFALWSDHGEYGIVAEGMERVQMNAAAEVRFKETSVSTNSLPRLVSAGHAIKLSSLFTASSE
jgi:hypothetical protein